MYTDISVSIKCDICNLSQKNMNIWSCIHKCLLHSWRYNYSNSSSTPFDTNVIRDCVILLSQRCHLNILSPIGTLSQRRRKKKKKVILISNQSYLKCNPIQCYLQTTNTKKLFSLCWAFFWGGVEIFVYSFWFGLCCAENYCKDVGEHNIWKPFWDK